MTDFMAFRQKHCRKVSPSDAFDQITNALEPHLNAWRFEIVEKKEAADGFGTRYVTFSDGTKYVRLTWNGKGQWFVLEGDRGPEHRPPSGQLIWIDLTLQLFDPLKGDEKWVGELIEDITTAFGEFAKAWD